MYYYKRNGSIICSSVKLDLPESDICEWQNMMDDFEKSVSDMDIKFEPVDKRLLKLEKIVDTLTGAVNKLVGK